MGAKDFVEGSGSLEVLEKRAAEHFGALLKAHVLGKNRGRGGLSVSQKSSGLRAAVAW